MPTTSRTRRPGSTPSSGRPSPGQSPKLAYKGVTEAVHPTTTTTTAIANKSSSVSPLSAPASHPAHVVITPLTSPNGHAKSTATKRGEEEMITTAEDLQLTATTHELATTTAAKAARNKKKREKKKLAKLEASKNQQQQQQQQRINNSNNNSNNKNKKKEKGVALAPPSQKSLVDLKRAFSHIHFEIQMQNDKTGRTTLFPRDLGLLFLWTVPSPIPLVEFPSIFLIKNKSKLKDVLVIYVNGWSYDKLMGTGVGLPREAETAEKEKETKKEQQAEEDDEETAKDEPEWHQQVCTSMLQFVRCNQCWARTEEKVQYAPLIIPNTVNALEQELFWRNDPPRAPGSRQSRAGAEGEGSSHTTTVSRGAEEKPPPSVAARFQLAKEIHSNNASPVTSNAAAATEKAIPPTTTTATTEAEVEEKGEDGQKEEEKPAVWFDNALLQQYALHWPEHTVELDALGFVLDVPPPPQVEDATTATTAAGKRPRDNDNEAQDTKNKNEGEEEENEKEVLLCLQEPWVSLPEDSDAEESGSKTKEKEEEEGEVAIYAFDCEMLLVGRQTSVLGRATLVDVKRDGATVLDVLVRSKDPVTNYVTRYSGLTEEMFAAAEAAREARGEKGLLFVAPEVQSEEEEKERNDEEEGEDLPPPPLPIVSLEEFQAAFVQLVTTHSLAPADESLKKKKRKITYIVGHSLENDFKAGKILPRGLYLLDSAHLYPHPAGLPFKNSLRFLTQRYLRRRIQQGAHDSAEDARASSDLVELKLRHGPTFGIREKVSVLQLMSHYNYPSSSTTGAGDGAAQKASIQLFDDAVTLSHVMPKQSTTTTTTSALSNEVRLDAIPCRHDDDVTKRVVRALTARQQLWQQQQEKEEQEKGQETSEEAELPFSFIWAQLTQTAVDVVRPRRSSTVGEEEITAHEAAQLQRVTEVNDRVRRMVEACPDETLVLVIAGECRGAASGNHFSRAQGAVFGFVKDASAPGPAVAATTTNTEKEEAEHTSPQQQPTATAASVEKPAACQQQ